MKRVNINKKEYEIFNVIQQLIWSLRSQSAPMFKNLLINKKMSIMIKLLKSLTIMVVFSKKQNFKT